MEEKQLHFNRPLLSVRRHAPVADSLRSEKRKTDDSRPAVYLFPSYRSELNSGPIANPAAVPFVWEQSPGQPNEDSKQQTQNSDKPSVAPKLLPRTYPKVGLQDSHKVSSGSVGRKNQAFSLPRTTDNERRDSNATCDENVENLEKSKETETSEEKASSSSGGSDHAYMDALSMLSVAESSFLNCSMSGLSGLDDVQAKSSSNFSADVQGRDFMMDRFLPAAKAVASETPHYAPKKQPILQQQPQQMKSRADQNKPSLRYGPSFAERYSHFYENEEETDDECDQRRNLPAACGLLPRFCLKSSLCLLNPIPAMSERTRVLTSSGKKVQPRSSSAGSYGEVAELGKDSTKLTNEIVQLVSSQPFLGEKEVNSGHDGKSDAGIQDLGLHVNGFKTFRELLEDQESDSGDPIIEKTSHVYSEHKVQSPDLRSLSPKTKDTDQTHAIDSSTEDLKMLNTLQLGENRDLNMVSTNEENIQESGVTEQESMESSEYRNYSQLPAAPPLLQCPSDSWLWRTLPSMHRKSSSPHSYHGAASRKSIQEGTYR